MGFVINHMEQFVNITDGAARFLDSWRDSSLSCIEAHTSGSTGSPKTVMLPKSDMIVSARATCDRFGITATGTMVCPLPVDYIAGKMMIVRALVSGARIYFEEPSNRPLASRYDVPVDLVPIVPSQIAGLTASPCVGMVRNVIVGGAPIPCESECQLHSMPFRSFHTYGMTETCSHVALREIVPGNDVYEAMPGVTFDVDSRGCLIVSAPGYSFGTIVTNDVADVVDSTHFKWRGRFDNVINTGGLKVFPETVERIISRYVEVPFYLTGIPDSLWGERVVMVVEGVGNELAERQIMDICRKYLSRHEVPKDIVFVERFKRTISGKVIRSTEF